MKQLSHQYCISRQSLGLLFMIMLTTSPSSAYQINLAKKSQTKTTPHVDLITELDQNGDGVLNYPEFSANNPRRFLLQDENGDGKLSMDEFVSNSDRVREKNKKKITKDKLHPKMANHNKEKLRQSHRKMLVSKFSSIDTNGDGQLSTDELHEDRFLRLDKDKNAILNAAELSIKRKGKKLTKKNRPENGRKTRDEIKLP